MRLFIIDENTEAEVCIYGIDGNENTEKFFITHFSGKGMKYLSDEEKKKFDTTADYAIKNVCYGRRLREKRLQRRRNLLL